MLVRLQALIAAPSNGCISIKLLLHACKCCFSNSTQVLNIITHSYIEILGSSHSISAIQSVKSCRVKAHLGQVMLDLLVACVVIQGSVACFDSHMDAG